MNTKSLLDKLVSQIGEATQRRDLAEITRLSKMAQRVQAIGTQFAALEGELAQIEQSLGAGGDVTASVPTDDTPFNLVDSSQPDGGGIVVEMDWGRCGINRPNTRISRRKVSETMVSVMLEMQAALGPDVLRKLSKIRVSRGPLVSQAPQLDYVNSKSGAIYVNHPIGHTGFYVLTHSSTSEKVAALKEAWRFLGLTPGALSIRKS